MERLQASGKGERYGDFLVHTLKPLIDARYRTRPERATTAVAGASMGGLISLYLAVRYPDVFAFAGVLSPSLWFADARIFSWLKAQVSAAPRARVYLDTGTREGNNAHDMQSVVLQARALADVLRARGHELRYLEAQDAEHNEAAWARRFPAALSWFLDTLPPAFTPLRTAPGSAAVAPLQH